MGSTGFNRFFMLAYLYIFLLCFICNFPYNLAEGDTEPVTERSPVKLSAILRNISQFAFPPFPEQKPEETTTVVPKRFPFRRRVNIKIRNARQQNRQGVNSTLLPQSANATSDLHEGESSRQPKALQLQHPIPPISKISGFVKGDKKNPQDLIRNALINHTLEHGGEQDLDKLVFSNLPNGSKLVLRTVRIIRTDEDGNPMDDSEHAQPTYWDVTLGNATDPPHDDEDDEESDSKESEEEASDTDDKVGSKVLEKDSLGKVISAPGALKSPSLGKNGGKSVPLRVRGGVKKKSDLESSGSHAAANYHHLNGYGTADREKEHGTTRFHGNTHGNTHKQTYTETDGKDVKPYHGTEKGVTDYANDHGKHVNDQGERFKSSKRKNKGRKVSGFKRVYHKEEYQRTEHFYDDEEAKKIAESFGLTEAKEADKHGTKGDKRKYQGVRTEYLDGKKHENEHGTHDGYNKGQQTQYKDSEKHSHHSNYGKSQSHGSAPQHNHHDYDYQPNHHHNHHQQQQQPHQDYHPNHNYHASYSNPKKSTISQVPKSLIDQLGGNGGGARSVASIIPAPMAHSFSVTEFAPLVAQSISTTDPTNIHVYHAFAPLPTNDNGTFHSSHLQNTNDNNYEAPSHVNNDNYGQPERKKPLRKRPRQRKMYFSPKHRPVQEDVNVENANVQLAQSFTTVPQNGPIPTVSYHVSSVSDILNSPDNKKNNGHGEIGNEKETQYTPYAPNFGPPPVSSQQFVAVAATPPQQDYNRHNNNGGHYPKTWHWSAPRRQKRPRPTAYSPYQMQLMSQKGTGYPRMNQMHLAGIPLRHASAFHRLGNRHYRYQTLKHHPKLRHPFEISTRKSDTDATFEDNFNGTSLYSDGDNDSAHYFNHNHRYAKHHLTSTIDPLKSNDDNNNNGVRNTLLDPTPGTYSTVIKVLPATMLNMNVSTAQQSGLDQHHVDSNSVKVLGQSTVTQRPLTQAESISITTAFPLHHPSPSEQQQLRPFLPKKRWLTFTFNLGNPDFKLGNEYGPSQHPFGQNSQKASKILKGIRNGILKPFRGAQAFVASSTSQQNHQFSNMAPLQPANQQILMFKRPRHPIFAHNVVSYNTLGNQSPAMSGMLPAMSKQQIQSVLPSSTSVVNIKNERPKFYYNYKPNEEEAQTEKNAEGINREGEIVDDEEGREDRKEPSVIHKPTLKVAKTLTTLPPVPRTTVAPKLKQTATKEAMESRIAGKQPTHPPPFINGIMDSVSDFFGRMG